MTPWNSTAVIVGTGFGKGHVATTCVAITISALPCQAGIYIRIPTACNQSQTNATKELQERTQTYSRRTGQPFQEGVGGWGGWS